MYKNLTAIKIDYTFIPRLIMMFPNRLGMHVHYSPSGFYLDKKVWEEKYFEMNSFVVVICESLFFSTILLRDWGGSHFGFGS